MERQRVVHYAKTKTAKVLRPGFSNRLVSSQAAELSHAPLASIESEFVVITKRRDETNMAPNLWEQLRKSSPQSNVEAKTIHDNSILFEKEHFYSEQSDFTPPRTYVRLRSAPDVDFKKDLPSLNKDNKLKSPEVEHSDQRLPTVNIDNNQALTLSNNKSFSTCSHDAQNVLLAKVNSPADLSGVQKQSYGTGSKLRNVVNKTNEFTHSNGKQTVASKTLPITRKMVVTRPDTQTISAPNSITENGFKKSTPCLPSSLNIKVNHAQHFNHCLLKQQNVTSQTNIQKVIDVDQSKLDCLKSLTESEQNQSKQQTKSCHISEIDNCSIILPEIVPNCKYVLNEDELLPELHSISPSAYTSNLRLTSERIARTYTHYTCNYKDNTNDHSLNTNTQFCPLVQNDKENTCKKLQQNAAEIQPQLIQNSGVNNNSSQYAEIDDAESQRVLSTADSDSKRVPESTVCWKRKSPTLATHASSSIPDLTSSSEHLSIQSRHLVNDDNIPISSGHSKEGEELKSETCPHKTCSDGHGSFLPSAVTSHSGTRSNVNNVIDMKDKTLLTNTNSKLLPRLNNLDKYDVKSLSFRLASVGISDVWLLEKDVCNLSDTNNSDVIVVNGNKCGIFDKTYHSLDQRYLIDRKSYKYSGQNVDDSSSNSVHEIKSQLNKNIYEDEVRKLKRRSFMLATCSMSDLTLLDDDDDVEFGNLYNKQSIQICNQKELKDFSVESINSNVFKTPESQVRLLRGDSFSSNYLNSSFGSFYSCRSHISSKTQHSQNTSLTKDSTHPGRKKCLKEPHLKYGKVFEDYSDSDSSVSGSGSVYYTASDNSFLTSSGASNNIPYMRHTIQRSPRLPLPGQWRKSPSNLNQQRLQSNVNQHGVFHKSNTLPHRGRSSKNSNPRGMIHCYGCGTEDGLSVQDQHRRRRNPSRGASSRSRNWVNPDYVTERPRVNRKRSNSAPSTRRAQTRHTDVNGKHGFPVHRQIYTEAKMSQNNISSGSGALGSSIPSAFPSNLMESDWENAPRIPPSLGRPRRKMYAGFDSQPLPMDSFLSDSSSVYSTQSCSSWGTSKSATVESCTRTSEMSSRARSVSSIASITMTPTGFVSQDDVFDFFTYTDKRSSMCENNHNLYLSSENPFQDVCLYDKAYSKDSLESILSNDTTVNVEHNFSTDNCLGNVKSPLHCTQDSTNIHNNKGNLLVVNDSKSSENEKKNNTCDFQFGPGFYNNGNCVNSESCVKHNNRLKSLKALSSSSLPKPKFLTKRKYFSSKDIFDLVMTSEKNDKGSKRRSKSLERQAQKMCEVILCLS